METKMIKTEGTATPAKLLELAISKDLDVDKLTKLMDLQERWDAQQAKKAFLIAMSDFQSKCPTLTKSKNVSFGNTSYNYIPLGEIAKQIKELLNECGLSYRWETKENGNISITCIVSHVDGHSESNTMTAQKDGSGSKNEIQQIGSTMTYLQRYTLIGALGISSADQDPDGDQPKKEEVKRSKTESEVLLKNAMKIVDSYETADQLQAKARPLLKEKADNGMLKEDQEKLTKYITAQYESFKPETQ